MEYHKTTKVSKNLQKNDSETVTNEKDKEIPKEIHKGRYISSKERQKINDDSRGMYNINSQTKFKTSMLKLNLCDYSDAYILVKGNITIATLPPSEANPNNNNKEVVFKNCAPFTDCIYK